MQYALLIYEKDKFRDDVSPDEWSALMEGHNAFWAKYGETGRVSGAAGLESHRTATSMRYGGEEYTVTDGPFVETREVLGGFYVVEAKDLDEAMAIARDIPVGPGDGIEIRPVLPTSESGDNAAEG